MTDKLLTFEQAADELGCSRSTIKRRVRAGDLPVFRDGRIVRVRSTDIDRYVLERVRRLTIHASPVSPVSASGVELRSGGRLWD